MSGVKMAVLDIDGTLLNPEGKIAEKTKETIGRAAKAGVTITLASGRPYAFVKPFLQRLGIDMPAMCCNGALVRDSRQVFYRSRFPWDKAQQVKDVAEKYGALLYVFDQDRIYCKPDKQIMRLFEETGAMDYIEKGNMLEFCQSRQAALEKGGENIVKLLIIEYDLEKYEKIKKEVLACGVLAVTPDPYNLDICPIGVSKGEALKRVAGQMNIPLSQVMAIGDGENDVSMIEAAGVGVAMGNGQEMVKARADYVTAGNDADGAALALERFIFGEER